jgi:hypothetical protein
VARSTRDLLNTLAAITASKTGFRSLGEVWSDATTAHGHAGWAGGVPARPDLDPEGEGRARAIARGQKMGIRQ